jgi:hypothetical protein
MSSGFTSNYNDSGYTLSSYTWFTNDNVVVSSVSSNDIYKTTQQCGVYVIDRGATSPIFPIFCSLKDLRDSSVPIDLDDAWLVYPGFGFIIYDNVNYVGTTSRTYINTDTKPRLFVLNGGNYGGKSTNIFTTTGSNFPLNQAASVKIFYRGEEITINGLTNF